MNNLKNINLIICLHIGLMACNSTKNKENTSIHIEEDIVITEQSSEGIEDFKVFFEQFKVDTAFQILRTKMLDSVSWYLVFIDVKSGEGRATFDTVWTDDVVTINKNVKEIRQDASLTSRTKYEFSLIDKQWFFTALKISSSSNYH